MEDETITQKLALLATLNRIESKQDLLSKRLEDLMRQQEEIKNQKDRLIWRLIVLLGSLAVSAMGLGSLQSILTGAMP